MKYIVYAVLVIVSLSCVLTLLSMFDTKREQAYSNYEDCIKEQYGMTAGAYQITFGEWPTCVK